MGGLLKTFGGSLARFRILATKGRASALCHLKHWIFAPPVDTPIPCSLHPNKIHCPLSSYLWSFIKICQNTPQPCWGDEWHTLSPGGRGLGEGEMI